MKQEIIIFLIGTLFGTPLGYYFRFFWQERFRSKGKKNDLQFETKSEIYAAAYDCYEELRNEPLTFMYELFNEMRFYKSYSKSLNDINSLTRKVNISLTIEESYRSKALQFSTNLLNVLLLSKDASQLTKSSALNSDDKLVSTMNYYELLNNDLKQLRDLSK